MKNLKHWIRYGVPKDQKYIVEYRDSLDGVVINANMIAHIPNAIAGFLAERATDKPFFIDPLTHAFQHKLDKILSVNHETGKSSIKSSLKKLRDRYGEPIKTVLNDKDPRSVTPDDFSENKAKVFCKSVLKFQKTHLNEMLKERDSYEYLKFLKRKSIVLEPIFLVAPYFYMSSLTFDDWLPLNLKFIKFAKESAKKNFPKDDIFAEIVIDKEVLNDKERYDDLVKKYTAVNPDGYLIWIDDFDTTQVGEKLLDNFVNFIKGLRAQGSPVINLYGDYFSVLLTKLRSGLTGIVHGPEYGESRSVVPVGGGIPLAKYYFLPLHKRMSYDEVANILLNKNIFKKNDVKWFYSKVCGCKICKETLKKDMNNFKFFGRSKPVRLRPTIVRYYPLEETKDKCLKHYLEVKAKEFEEIRQNSLKDALKKLGGAFNEYKGLLGLEDTVYLRVWENILNEKREK